MQSTSQTTDTFPGLETTNVIRTCWRSSRNWGKEGGSWQCGRLPGEGPGIALLGTLKRSFRTNIFFYLSTEMIVRLQVEPSICSELTALKFATFACVSLLAQKLRNPLEGNRLIYKVECEYDTRKKTLNWKKICYVLDICILCLAEQMIAL